MQSQFPIYPLHQSSCFYDFHPISIVTSVFTTQVTMEPSHTQPRSGFPSRIGTLPRQNLLPDSVILRSWVKSKLDTIPYTYSKYEEGMQAIKNQIQQDFFPEHHSHVMQAFYQEFYASIGVISGETGEGLWARWRANPRMEVEHCRRISSLYGIADIEDPQLVSQDRKAALDILAGISQSVDTARERQIRTSVLISEAEAKLLHNRNSNYWGDLAIPVLPQTADKAKIVYIPPKSARNTLSIENQQLGIDPTILVRSLSRHKPNRSLRRNSLPSPIDGSNAKSIAGGLSVHSNAPPSVANVKDSASLHAAAGDASVTIQKSVVPLDAKNTHGGNFFLPYSESAPIAFTAGATFESPYNRPEKSSRAGVTYSNTTSTFGRSTKIRPDFSLRGTSEDTNPLPYTLVARGTSGGTTERQEVTGIKLLDTLHPGGVRVSPSENIGLAVRRDDNVLGIHLEGVPLHEVHQGHGTLGIRSPVVSMMASPTAVSFATGERDTLYQVKTPQTIKKSMERLAPTPPSTREHSPFPFYEFPESAYSGSSRDSSNDSGARSTRESYGRSLSIRDLDLQNGIVRVRAEGSYPSKTLENSHTQESLRHGEDSTSLNQYQPTSYEQVVSNSTPVTRNNSTETSHIEELDVTNSYTGVTPKL